MERARRSDGKTEEEKRNEGDVSGSDYIAERLNKSLADALLCYIGAEYYIHLQVVFQLPSRAGSLNIALGYVIPFALLLHLFTLLSNDSELELLLNIYHQ